MNDTSKPKAISLSVIDGHTELLFPNDLNAHGTAFGGKIIAIADRLAATVAQRHHGGLCALLSMDAARFLAPARQGEALIYRASVNRTWRTSMEIGVKVFSENLKTGERSHIVSAYMTFVAIDQWHHPIPIRLAIPRTREQKRRWEEAGQRREARLASLGGKK